MERFSFILVIIVSVVSSNKVDAQIIRTGPRITFTGKKKQLAVNLKSSGFALWNIFHSF